MKNELDELLTHVLTPTEEPGDLLNRRILEQVKESKNMKQRQHGKISAAVAAAAFVAATSITAAAAWQYRSAPEVADRLGEGNLASHFIEQMSDTDDTGEKSGDTENIGDGKPDSMMGESRICGGYKVTVLGIVSGEELSESDRVSDGSVRSDRTYCAVAIQKEDGTPVNGEEENFFVSPLIGGLNPGLYNAASLCGSYSEFMEDGILYRLVDCDNIMYFADHKLYLCVTDTGFYESSLYRYDEITGEISRNEEYEGLNVLFDLEMDAALADPVRAQNLLAELDGQQTREEEETELPEGAGDAMAWAERLTPENIEQYCVRMENTVQTVTVNKDGYYVIQPWLVNEAVSDSRGGGGAEYNAKFFTPELYEPGALNIEGYSGSTMEELVITTFTLNEDGSMTFAAWVPEGVSDYLK